MLRKSAMYNLKVSTSLATGAGGGPGGGPGAGLLAADPQGVTPRTPEILNSLMAMSHPLDPYANSDTPNPTASAAVPELSSPSGARGASSFSSAASVSAPPVSPTRSPPSLQHTRSQLIKEGLKLTLQTKRRHTSATSASGASASGASGDEDDELSIGGKRVKQEELTPEDEERRRRRRERNKVAATKCRIKKRERTVNLVQESAILESQNYELKSQIQELETQRRRLVDMLSSHSPACTRPGHVHQPPQQQQQQPQQQQLQPQQQQPQQQQQQQQPPPPPYDMYSPATPYCSPSPGAAPDLGLGHPQPHGHDQPHGQHGYDDVLLGQYVGAAPGAAQGAGEDDHLPPYFAVTKHEIVDDPLLAALDDSLGIYGFPGHHLDMTEAGPGPGPGAGTALPHHSYGRPSILALDTPVSTPGSTPGSLGSPASHGPMGVGPGGGGGPLPGPSHHYPHGQHMLGMPLTPLPLSPEAVGVFGMDSGCMA